eukprot:4848239-Prymnesium_polylepis.2
MSFCLRQRPIVYCICHPIRSITACRAAGRGVHQPSLPPQCNARWTRVLDGNTAIEVRARG